MRLHLHAQVFELRAKKLDDRLELVRGQRLERQRAAAARPQAGSGERLLGGEQAPEASPSSEIGVRFAGAGIMRSPARSGAPARREGTYAS